jgi:hypothetical protein
VAAAAQGRIVEVWSPDRVVRAIRHSLGRVAQSYTPYFPELFDEGLAKRVRHPADIDFDPARVGRPWPIKAAGKRYFVPGSFDDLIHYTSCVIACCPAIERAWADSGVSEDCGPPTRDELAQGLVGEAPWKQYWNEFHRRSREIAKAGYPWVLNADIENCAAAIDGEKLADLLLEWGCDRDAVRIFGDIQRAWRGFGFPGLPVTGTFSLLTRAYLLEVEQRLRDREIIFLRTIDDFRLFSRTRREQEAMIMAIVDCLAVRDLRLNESKTRFEQFGGAGATSRRRLLIIRGKGRYGLVRPLLVRLTARRMLRWFSLFLLQKMVKLKYLRSE